jgi:hypothetical protein
MAEKLARDELARLKRRELPVKDETFSHPVLDLRGDRTARSARRALERVFEVS